MGRLDDLRPVERSLEVAPASCPVLWSSGRRVGIRRALGTQGGYPINLRTVRRLPEVTQRAPARHCISPRSPDGWLEGASAEGRRPDVARALSRRSGDRPASADAPRGGANLVPASAKVLDVVVEAQVTTTWFLAGAGCRGRGRCVGGDG
jgi:hypothetical protein